MGRHRTISDEEVLLAARQVFRHHGHSASTRQVARAAGISEAVLYQRFGSKDQLFFAAMHATGPDLEALLGPAEPVGPARAYLRGVVSRLGEHFAGVIPLALRVMTHPSFDPATVSRSMPENHQSLQQALAARLTVFARRGELAGSAAIAARLLVSLAHDWALGVALAHEEPAGRGRELRALVDVVWEGLRPRDS